MQVQAIFISILIMGIISGGAKIELGGSDDLRYWFITNDGVMGGLSRGNIKENKNSLTFYGNISLENNGGFSRVQRQMQHKDLSAFKGIKVKLKGDGRKYDFTLEKHNNYVGPTFRKSFVAEEKWKTYYFAFDEFDESFFGRKMGRKLSEWNDIQRIGVILADKKPGPFEIEIDWIDFE
ncbi:MAG: CIA30 family protein [Bacteroidota bacterium]